MRLLNAGTRKFEQFFDADTPPYTIFSHTWGKTELTYQQYLHENVWQHHDPNTIPGLRKIDLACKQTLKHRQRYTWIDTICIDKTSSAELTEAINSMFAWYRNSVICYAYLEDVRVPNNATLLMWTSDIGDAFASARWFTRGWTLQELLAPQKLVFFSADWVQLGDRKSLARRIATITNIDITVLQYPGSYKQHSVAVKMSWASGRRTSRREDIAYCLLGLFDVNMPLLYGEGAKAFTRLQEEIIKMTDDPTIFVWKNEGDLEKSLLLAPSPDVYQGFTNLTQSQTARVMKGYAFNNAGLVITLSLRYSGISGYYVADLEAESQCSGPAHLWLRRDELVKNKISHAERFIVASPVGQKFFPADRIRYLSRRKKCDILILRRGRADRQCERFKFQTDASLTIGTFWPPECGNDYRCDLSGSRFRYGAVELCVSQSAAHTIDLKFDTEVMVLVFGRTELASRDPNILVIRVVRKPIDLQAVCAAAVLDKDVDATGHQAEDKCELRLSGSATHRMTARLEQSDNAYAIKVSIEAEDGVNIN